MDRRIELIIDHERSLGKRNGDTQKPIPYKGKFKRILYTKVFESIGFTDSQLQDCLEAQSHSGEVLSDRLSEEMVRRNRVVGSLTKMTGGKFISDDWLTLPERLVNDPTTLSACYSLCYRRLYGTLPPSPPLVIVPMD